MQHTHIRVSFTPIYRSCGVSAWYLLFSSFSLSYYKSFCCSLCLFASVRYYFCWFNKLSLYHSGSLDAILLSLFSTGNALPRIAIAHTKCWFWYVSQSVIVNCFRWMCRPICMRTTENMICNQAASQQTHSRTAHIEMVLNMPGREREKPLMVQQHWVWWESCLDSEARWNGREGEMWSRMKNPDAKIHPIQFHLAARERVCYHKQAHSHSHEEIISVFRDVQIN